MSRRDHFPSRRGSIPPREYRDADRYIYEHKTRRDSLELEHERSSSISPLSSQHSVKEVQGVWNPSSTQDMTIHLEVDIEEDIESLLEEFSRLKRVGNFRAAQQYFQSNLRNHIDLQPVAIEYADMLLNQGAFKDLKELLLNQEITRTVSQLVDQYRATKAVDSDPIMQALRAEISKSKRFDELLRLIEASSKLCSEGSIQAALVMARLSDERLSREGRREGYAGLAPDSTPTQVQIICHLLEIKKRIVTTSNSMSSHEIFNVCSDWSGLYQDLKAEGRIWEVRDIISASLYAFGVEETCRNIFETDLHSSDFFEKVFKDWKAEDYDESTYLAVFDILVLLGRSLLEVCPMPSERDIITAARQCLDHAKLFATCIKENNPEDIKSRQYIRWILARQVLERYMGYFDNQGALRMPALHAQYMAMFPGLTLWSGSLPVYLPSTSENPGWPGSNLSAEPNELLHTVLEASRELGDYSTEVECLRELICRSSDPKGLFEQLVYLQESVQGDMMGCLETHLTKYLLTTNHESRQALSDEIDAIDTRLSVPDHDTEPLIKWCQLMVQMTLYHSLRPSSKDVKLVQKLETVQQKLMSIADRIPERVANDAFALRPYILGNRFAERDIAQNTTSHRRRGIDGARASRGTIVPIDSEGVEDRGPVAERPRAHDILPEKEGAKNTGSEKPKHMLAHRGGPEQAARDEYQNRLKKVLRESGVDEEKMATILKKVQDPYYDQPIWTRLSRRCISIETLNKHRLGYMIDSDPNYVIVKKALPRSEVFSLLNETRELRERRERHPAGAETENKESERYKTGPNSQPPPTPSVIQPTRQVGERVATQEQGIESERCGVRSPVEKTQGQMESGGPEAENPTRRYILAHLESDDESGRGE